MASRRGPDNSVRVSIQGNNGSVNWANVFWCQLTTSGSISQADLDTWTANFAGAYNTNFVGMMPGDSAMVSAHAVLFTPGGGVLESQVAAAHTGTGGTAIGDDAACRVVSWLSTVYWRGGKPRTYLPGLTTNDTTDGKTLVGATITALKSGAAAFRTAVNALTNGGITGTSLGFVSFRSGNAERATPLFFAFTGSTVHPRIGTQRRRLGRWTA